MQMISKYEYSQLYFVARKFLAKFVKILDYTACSKYSIMTRVGEVTNIYYILLVTFTKK